MTNEETDKNFTQLLSLLNEMLLDKNILLIHNYDAKRKNIYPINIVYKNIRTCSNDIIPERV